MAASGGPCRHSFKGGFLRAAPPKRVSPLYSGMGANRIHVINGIDVPPGMMEHIMSELQGRKRYHLHRAKNPTKTDGSRMACLKRADRLDEALVFLSYVTGIENPTPVGHRH